MNSPDDTYCMNGSLSSSLEQTPLSSLSAASSYSSLVNCDETLVIQQREQTQSYGDKMAKESFHRLDTTSDDSANPKTNHGYTNINKRSSYSTLLNRHTNKLYSVLEEPIEIHGQGNFPTLNIVSKDFLIELRTRLPFESCRYQRYSPERR